ncbi:MAG: 16S rRNA (guanine(527)-N(7))-methyltransferase RsmG [Opitutales bacterium]|nr:16S rRNA (guanine(527)-N(7))-methyltransferase RsmG [Opitutales bacterium]
MTAQLESLKRNFPDVTEAQWAKLEQLTEYFKEWNERINLVSRKDIEAFEVHHLMHAMSLSKVVKFEPRCRVLDVGTGGGLPGLPLAILFPQVKFYLLDSIAKKINAVKDMAERLELKNVEVVHKRAEELESSFHYVLGRAVTSLPTFLGWTSKNLREGGEPEQPYGVLYFKGTLYKEELESMGLEPFKLHALDTVLDEPYFADKFLIHLDSANVKAKAVMPEPVKQQPKPETKKKKKRKRANSRWGD